MSKPDIILIGSGGHARACVDVIEQQGRFRIAGFTGLEEEVGQRHFGYTVLAVDAELPRLAKDYQYAIVAVGQIDSPGTRKRLFEKVSELGFNLPSVVSPAAHVSDHAHLGAGTIVMHAAIINAGANVGSNCIVNTRALIEHDVVVGDHCHVSTGAILNGSATVGSGSFLGSGCVIRDRICIGRNCVIGMGQSVRHNQADNSVFAGHQK